MIYLKEVSGIVVYNYLSKYYYMFLLTCNYSWSNLFHIENHHKYNI